MFLRGFRFFCAILLVLLYMGGGGICLAGTTSQPETIHIEADRMEAEQQRNLVVFTGHVEARQGEVVITGDKMVVNYLESDTPSAEKLTQRIGTIQAYGNVKIVKQDWVATGDVMEYSAIEKKVKLTGNASARQDNNIVTGETIFLYLDKGRSVVERSSKEGERVKALIYPGPTSETGNGPGQSP